MQIILLDKVVNLGNLGEVVKVKDGYARNFLIPSGRARRATAVAIKEFEVKRAELEKVAAAKLAECQAQGAKLGGTVVKLTQKAGVDGQLGSGDFFKFGAVDLEFLDGHCGGAASAARRDQEIAGVTVFDFNDFTQIAQVHDFVEQNNLHAGLLTGYGAGRCKAASRGSERA